MKRNVLSIGRNQSMNYLIKTVLSNLYQLTMVEDVFHGMHELKNKQYISLILIDIDYQTKEGIDFIQHINSSKLHQKPLIILSSAEIQHKNEYVIKNNVLNYFIKPFNPIDLVKSIDELTMRE